MGYYIQFHGVACFSIHSDNMTIVFDPHNGISMDLPPPTVKNADLILISHKHYDHNNGKNLVCRNDNSTIVYEEIAGEFEFNGIKIIGTKVKHGGDPKWGWNVIYSIKLPSGPVIIHGGDMGDVPDENQLQRIISLGTPDIIILPIGGEFCLDADGAIQVSEMIKPKITTIVCHYLYGPLLKKDDFQGMSDEKPFLEKAGQETLIIRNGKCAESDLHKKYALFEPII